MSEKIEKLLALAFDIRTQDAEANNAFSLARKLLGNTSIPDFLGLGSKKNEITYQYSIENLPASHKDNYIEFFIKNVGRIGDIRIISLKIDSERNLVTTPSTVCFEYSTSNRKSKDKLSSACKDYIENFNSKLKKPKQNFNDGMTNINTGKPYQNYNRPEQNVNTEKDGFWKKIWKWIKGN